jgi:tetratricopeptide (TPR) repeat protein
LIKYFVIPLVLLSISLKAQILKFNKKTVECEDKWVAFQNDNNSFAFGFIYIDFQAGLTFEYEGNFRVEDQDKFVLINKNDSSSVKVRLEPNQRRVALIPEEKFKELKIEPVPDWLQYYKTDTASIQRLYRWGFLYNSWGLCSKALTYLEKAQKIDQKFKGLEFELAYSYNCLEQFNKAITVLQSAIKTTPDDCYLYKELSYAEMHIGQLENAAETCNKGISICAERILKAEIAYNLAYQYYKIKDKENFNLWFDKTKKWAEKNDQFMSNLNKMKEDLKE